MTKLQFVANICVMPFVITAIALFIAVNFVYDLLKYGKVRPTNE